MGGIPTMRVDTVKLKKLKCSIHYSFDGKLGKPIYEGTAEEVNTTWMMMRVGFCNDDLAALINIENRGE
jgi:Fe-S cluster biosynthesis and repair protein YggX